MAISPLARWWIRSSMQVLLVASAFARRSDTLSRHGVTELDKYAVTPGNRKFIPDFFVD